MTHARDGIWGSSGPKFPQPTVLEGYRLGFGQWLVALKLAVPKGS